MLHDPFTRAVVVPAGRAGSPTLVQHSAPRSPMGASSVRAKHARRAPS
ncbi:hypothetical protein A7982_13331 [Minicystis rosea]|nr:hypothetical protein A7982_13331 [Minicystis rosea]